MSGLDIVIYIAGLLLLIQLFIERLTKLVQLWRRLMSAAREPLPAAQQPVASIESGSKRVSGLATRNHDE
jgi:hypothetical protein